MSKTLERYIAKTKNISSGALSLNDLSVLGQVGGLEAFSQL